MIKDIVLTGTFGEMQKKIKITAPHGAGSTTLHIFIDNWYQGIFSKVNGEWTSYLNSKSDLDVNDVNILNEMINRSG